MYRKVRPVLLIWAILTGCNIATAENLMPYYDALFVDCDGVSTCYTLESRPKVSFENVERCVLTFGMSSECQPIPLQNETIGEDAIEKTEEEVQKVIINNRFYIIGNEKTFNLNGSEIDIK